MLLGVLVAGYGLTFIPFLPSHVVCIVDFLALLKNDITGTIPSEYGLLTNMTRLDMQEMDLFGTIPSELGLMSLLSKFSSY